MLPTTPELSSDVWYERDSMPYVQQVSTYISHQVSSEMFQISTQKQYLSNLDYPRYLELQRSVFTSVLSQICPPPWGLTPQPFFTHPPTLTDGARAAQYHREKPMWIGRIMRLSLLAPHFASINCVCGSCAVFWNAPLLPPWGCKFPPTYRAKKISEAMLF